MPRQRRIHVSGGLYHAVLRGNHRQAIFAGSDDYLCFEEIVARALERYIHLNPVRARMVDDPSDYRWSSHRAYLGVSGPNWLHIAPVLERLGRSVDAARAAYRCLMNEAPAAVERDALSTTLQSGRARRGERDTLAIPSPDMPGRWSPRSLEAIAAEVAQAHEVTIEELRSTRRRPELVQVRGLVARRALLEGAANLSQVARYLNRAPSTISGLLHGRR